MNRQVYQRIFCILLALILLASCTPPPQSSGVTPTTAVLPQPSETNSTPAVQPTETQVIQMPTNEIWHLLLLGDSSLGSIAETYPPIIEKDMGVKVEVENYSLGGLTIKEVLTFLKTGETERPELRGLTDAIREAEVVVLFIGNPDGSLIPENQFNMNGCLFDLAPPVNCAPSSLTQYTADLKWIWSEIFRLRAGKPTILRTMDLYTPLVIEYKNRGLFAACTECLVNYSNAIRSAAEAYNIPFVSRYEAYNGVNHDEDPVAKGYIYSDGEHPSTLGGQVMAELFASLGYKPVPPP